MKTSIVIVALLSISLLVLAGCVTGSATGAVPSAPPAPSGGGCGIGAPADNTVEAALAADTDASAAL